MYDTFVRLSSSGGTGAVTMTGQGASMLRTVPSKAGPGASSIMTYTSHPAEPISTEPSGYWPATSLHLAPENVTRMAKLELSLSLTILGGCTAIGRALEKRGNCPRGLPLVPSCRGGEYSRNDGRHQSSYRALMCFVLPETAPINRFLSCATTPRTRTVNDCILQSRSTAVVMVMTAILDQVRT